MIATTKIQRKKNQIISHNTATIIATTATVDELYKDGLSRDIPATVHFYSTLTQCCCNSTRFLPFPLYLVVCVPFFLCVFVHSLSCSQSLLPSFSHTRNTFYLKIYTNMRSLRIIISKILDINVHQITRTHIHKYQYVYT